jgi:hypothetical protein
VLGKEQEQVFSIMRLALHLEAKYYDLEESWIGTYM